MKYNFSSSKKMSNSFEQFETFKKNIDRPAKIKGYFHHLEKWWSKEMYQPIKTWSMLPFPFFSVIKLCLEKNVIIFSKLASSWYAHAQSVSHVWPSATLWTITHQAPLSMGFLGKNTGAGCHFFLQGIFPAQELKSCLPCLLMLYRKAIWITRVEIYHVVNCIDTILWRQY